MPQLHLHVYPGGDAASQHHQTSRTRSCGLPSSGQEHLLPQGHRKAHRRLQPYTHSHASRKSLSVFAPFHISYMSYTFYLFTTDALLTANRPCIK
jgi:hypothetical protein